MDANAFVKLQVLPERYKEYEDVFSEDRANELAPHTQYDHAIELEDGKAPPHMPIYNMSQTELRLLREYSLTMRSRCK